MRRKVVLGSVVVAIGIGIGLAIHQSLKEQAMEEMGRLEDLAKAYAIIEGITPRGADCHIYEAEDGLLADCAVGSSQGVFHYLCSTDIKVPICMRYDPNAVDTERE